MATGSGAFGVKGGFNQSGGGYYIALEDLWVNRRLNILTPGTGSGGATTVGSFTQEALATSTNYPAGLNVSSFFANGALVKDMGRTVVSAGRTFRKIQGIQPTNQASSNTFGVGGNAASATAPGYLTYYVETPRDGANADISAATTDFARLARYF
jgi:hypothetical protein